MHEDFDPLSVDWSFFSSLPDPLDIIGGGGAGYAQCGGGGANYPVFAGMAYQRGAGIGSVLRSLWRILLPIGRQAGAAIGRQGLESGNRVLAGVLDGKDLKETLTTEAKSGLKNLLEKAADSVSKQKGSGSFDFKRYKRRVADGGEDDGNARGNSIKKRLHSTMGPSIATASSIANIEPASKRKRKTTISSSSSKRGKKRVDILGPY